MRPETRCRIELEKLGIPADETTVSQLSPMLLRWEEYIRQTREIDIDPATEPFCTIEDALTRRNGP